MAVVKDYMDGNCRIVIHDDCCITDPDEVKKILDSIAEIYVRSRMKARLEEQMKTESNESV